ncbi:MAG TPA: tetratricopeptide repeat protein [Pyrinomonadaceae bacterium]|nr:tetratricopeptide repeat protein [Pyrinomonadaceae bacterium]
MKLFFVMPSRLYSHVLIKGLLIALVLLVAPSVVRAQGDEFGDDAVDPFKLFQQGENRLARFQKTRETQDLEEALEFYEEAARLKPEFPEAEYQRGYTLVLLNRASEGEKAYRRAAELRPDWALPRASLGSLLARTGREQEAEPLLRRALELDGENLTALAALAAVRGRAGDKAEAVKLWRRATAVEERAPTLWLARGAAEQEAKDPAAAAESFSRALELEPRNTQARLRRAEAYLDAGDKKSALTDLRNLQDPARRDTQLAIDIAALFDRAGQREEAREILKYVPEEAKRDARFTQLEAALTPVNCDDTPEARAALEKLLASEPRNASLLSCLGQLNRKADPEKALEYFRRAAEIEPRNVSYATGYAASLIQLRRFAPAANILKQVLAVAPEDYPAHANFATALYELKLYKQAIVEYEWIARARPDLAVVYYFIGSAHDHLGEYHEALAAYETFIARADAATNQLEIEKVNLRLPTLRNQIKRGEGKKKGRDDK